jgi:translation initiation factor 2 beta subunit (eIF-2beta)/eIF-5
MAKYKTCMECHSVEVRSSKINREDSEIVVFECDECGAWDEVFTAAAAPLDLTEKFELLRGPEIKELRGS